MVCKDQVAEILESQEFFITFCEDGVNKVRISTTQVGFNYIDAIQLDVGTHDDTYGMCISTTVYFNKDEFDKAFSMMCDIIKNSNIEVCGKNRFGGYVGFKEYCALVDKKGKWKISE